MSMDKITCGEIIKELHRLTEDGTLTPDRANDFEFLLILLQGGVLHRKRKEDIPTAVLKTLSNNPKNIRDIIKEVKGAIPTANAQAIRSALSYFHKNKKVESPERGHWKIKNPEV